MLLLIGTDEAGYGPNLGPLCVSGTRWRYDRPSSENFLADLQADLDSLCAAGGAWPVFDSKKLFHSSGTVAPLEKTVLTTLFLLDGPTAFDKRSCRQFFDRISPLHVTQKIESNRQQTLFDFAEELDGPLEESVDRQMKRGFPIPIWETNVDFFLPVEQYERDKLCQNAEYTLHFLQERGIQLTEVRTRRIQPVEFNSRLNDGLLKSDLLAEATLQIVRSLLPSPSEPFPEQYKGVTVLCDKLGGRNTYLQLLKIFFSEYRIEKIVESRAVSIYQLTGLDGSPVPIEIRFQMKGESNRPTALASIFSKYIRELSMRFFNQFWKSQLPELVPTAGYPVDAKRFRNDVQEKISELNIAAREFWRNK